MFKDKQELEGILGLWVWSLKSDRIIETGDPVTGLKKSTAIDIQARRIVPSDQDKRLDLKIWLGDDINSITSVDYALRSVSADIEDASAVWKKKENKYLVRFVGGKAAHFANVQDSTVVSLLSAPSKCSLVSPCAQEVFASLITSILDIVDDIGPIDVQEAEPFRVENSPVIEIVGLLTEMQLGSRQEALLCDMPLMIPQLRLTLRYAAYNGDEAVINERLEAGEVGLNAKNNIEWTPLYCAARNGHEAIVTQLQIEEVEPDAKDIDGRRPLSGAAQNRYIAIVTLLLGTDKVDPHAKDKDDRTPLSWAAQNGHEDFVTQLLRTVKVNPPGQRWTCAVVVCGKERI